MSEKKYVDLKTLLERQHQLDMEKQRKFFPHQPLKTDKKPPITSDLHERWVRWVNNIDH